MSTLRLLGVAAILFTGQVSLRAETDFNIVGREVAGMLQNHHYAKIRFDGNLSARILNTYLEDLDPSRLLFTEADVEDFKKKVWGRDSRTVVEEAVDGAGHRDVPARAAKSP